MKKQLIVSMVLGFYSAITFAGQGLYLKINSYIPSNIQVTASNCVDGANNIAINNTTYLSANNDGTCFFEKSWVNFSLTVNNQITNYSLNISASGSSLSPQGLLNLNNAQVVATLYPHPGITGTQDWVNIAIANSEDSWMKQSSSIIGNKSIDSVIMAGSHDTGTYGISDQSEVTSDISDTLKFWLQFDPLKIQHLKNWAVTQNLDVKSQLAVGIRYLDLRLCKSSAGTLTTCHSVSGDSMPNIVNQAAVFLNDPNHNQEIIIMDFNHLYNISNADIDALALMFKNAFGTKLASSFAFFPSNKLSDFWNQQKQVIVLIDNEYAISTYPEIFWSENAITSPYPDAQAPDVLEAAMHSALMERDQAALFVLQSQETPTDQTIINSFNPVGGNPGTLFQMTNTYKHDINDWLGDANNQALIKQAGNIIFEDFTNGIDVTELAKQLNQINKKG